jgi:agmatine deiminase
MGNPIISRRQLLSVSGALMGVIWMDCVQAVNAKSRQRPIFRMPEESARHTRTFMQWPVNRTVHPDAAFLEDLQQAIADIGDIPTDDLWCPDSGPVFVTDDDKRLAVTHLNFNGWGGKQVHGNDGKVARRVAQRLELPIHDNGLVGEAGGVEFDGRGTLITHESSWVNDNRNRGSREAVGKLLLEAFGGEKVVWAPGVKGVDITDYHIDSLARFIEPVTVLIQLPDTVAADDPWSVAAMQTYRVLEAARDAEGNRFELVVIPDPHEIRVQSDDFVASYVNYYLCNGAAIAAQFGDQATDERARRVLGELYPDLEIVTLDVDPIGEVGGGIHCATQQ